MRETLKTFTAVIIILLGFAMFIQSMCKTQNLELIGYTMIGFFGMALLNLALSITK